MCSVKAPKPQVIEQTKPTFVRNPFLDELDADVASADALRRGRSSLVIPGNNNFNGRGGSGSATGTGNPNGNSANPLGGAGSSGGGSGSGPYNSGNPPSIRVDGDSFGGPPGKFGPRNPTAER